MKIRGADSTSPPTRTSVGDWKTACPCRTVQPGMPRSQRSTPARDGATTASARALTAAMSTRIAPSITTP